MPNICLLPVCAKGLCKVNTRSICKVMSHTVVKLYAKKLMNVKHWLTSYITRIWDSFDVSKKIVAAVNPSILA